MTRHITRFRPGGGGGGNSSSTLVPMREQENAYKGVFFRDKRVYVRIRERGGG